MNRIDQYRLIGRTLAAPSEGLAGLATEWEGMRDAWPQLLELATQHRVAPALYTAMSRGGMLEVIPPDFRAALSALRMFNRERNDRIVAQAREITSTLHAAGITPLYFKGAAHILTGLYDHPGDRMAGDIDLFVGEKAMLPAVAALQAIGYTNEDPKYYYDTGAPRTHHHYPPLIREGLPAQIEIHRALILAPYDRLFRSMRDAEMTWGDGDARFTTLSPAHAFAQSVLHTEVQHYHARLGVTHLGMLLDSLKLARLASEPDLEAVLAHFAGEQFQQFSFRHTGLMTLLFGADAIPAPLRSALPRAELARLQRQTSDDALARCERMLSTAWLLARDDWRAGKQQWTDAQLRRVLIKRMFQPALYRNRLQKFAKYFSAKP